MIYLYQQHHEMGSIIISIVEIMNSGRDASNSPKVSELVSVKTGTP